MKRKKVIIPIITMLVGFTITAQNIEINVNATKTKGKIEPFWASQIVHPTEFLLTEWGKDFISLLKETGAARQYIRLYNQPEEAIRVSADGKITYDWSRFDEKADLILLNGLKPKVMFFGMPVELAAFPDELRVRPYGAKVCKSRPEDYKQWEELCADFTRHVISKYGIEEVKQWTFRCWNEPDGGSFWYTGMDDKNLHIKEYLKLYDHFANGVKKVHPDVRIGGPALTNSGTFRRPENFKMVLDHFANGVNFATGEIGSPLDFISVHTYGSTMNFIKRENNFIDYAPSVDYMVNLLNILANIRDQFPQLRETPIHVEEWGICGAGTTGIKERPQADIRNSEYGSAFLTALAERIISIKQENDRNIEAFTFCTSGYERIPENDFMGYRTFHTKNGFHKPLLNGYKLLYRLASEMVPVTISNNNEHVKAFATRNSEKITIVITNFQHDRIYNGGPSNMITLNTETKWEPETKVNLKHWRIDKNHSNAYTAFKEAGSPKLANPFEIDAIKKRMDLELLEPERQTIMEDITRLEFELPCNGVSLIEIARK